MMLFQDSEDKYSFLQFISKRIIETDFRCYAWALMDTHYHLLIRTSEKPLWQLMKPLNTEYARYFNRKYNRRGPLFADRYKSIATQDQFYLEQLLAYIHLNPIRAGVCKSIVSLRNYPWTGHSAIMGEIVHRFQDVGTVLKKFGKTNSIARQNYLIFLNENLQRQNEENIGFTTNLKKGKKYEPGCWVIGDEAFQHHVLQKDKQKRLAVAKYLKEGLSLEDMAQRVANKFKIKIEILKMQSRRSIIAKARLVFCYLACEAGFKTKKVGDFLGIGQAAVSHAARKGLMVAKEFNINIL
jgi:REP element-mobilizing transposase RayT